MCMCMCMCVRGCVWSHVQYVLGAKVISDNKNTISLSVNFLNVLVIQEAYDILYLFARLASYWIHRYMRVVCAVRASHCTHTHSHTHKSYVPSFMVNSNFLTFHTINTAFIRKEAPKYACSTTGQCTQFNKFLSDQLRFATALNKLHFSYENIITNFLRL